VARAPPAGVHIRVVAYLVEVGAGAGEEGHARAHGMRLGLCGRLKPRRLCRWQVRLAQLGMGRAPDVPFLPHVGARFTPRRSRNW
jgi:hypothetical protein